MEYVFVLARLLASLMVIPLLLASALFSGSLDLLWKLYGTATIAAFALDAVSPRKYFRLPVVRRLIMLLYVAAVCLTMPIMLRDLTLINHPDYPAFILRGIGVLVITLMIVEALKFENGSD